MHGANRRYEHSSLSILPTPKLKTRKYGEIDAEAGDTRDGKNKPRYLAVQVFDNVHTF